MKWPVRERIKMTKGSAPFRSQEKKKSDVTCSSSTPGA